MSPQDLSDNGGLNFALDFASQMDQRPLNRKIWGAGNGWYHTPPGEVTFEATPSNVNPWTYQTPDQFFATPPSTR